MITSTDFINSHISTFVSENVPQSNKQEDSNISFAQLLNETDNQKNQISQMAQNEESIQDQELKESNNDFEETEIEIELSESDSSVENEKSSIFKFVEKKQAKDDNLVNCVSGLNDILQKNSDLDNKKLSVLSLLDTKQIEKVKISVKNLDSMARTKAVAVLKDLKMGKISQNDAMISLADIVANSKIGKEIKANKSKLGKNVKITARSVKAQSNENVASNLEKRISQNDLVAVNKLQDITETKLNKTNKTDNMEVSRNELQKTKVKGARNEESVSISDSNNAQKQLDTLITEVSLKSDDVKSNGVAKSDIKAVLTDNKQTIFNNLVDNTKLIQTQGMTKFTMVMRPENVGRIDFQLSIKDGKIGGKIILQSQEAAEFFKANVEEITAVFRKANVELSGLDVALAGQNQNQQNNQFAQNSQGQGFSNEMLDTMRVSAHYSNKAISAFESNTTFVSNGSYSGINLLI